MQFLEAVESLKDIYHSLDVRVVTFLHDGMWKLGYCAIRFRYETIEELQKQHDDLLQKIGRIDTNDIKVRLYAFSPEKWNSIKQYWHDNYIQLEDNFTVHFEASDELYREVSAPTNQYNDLINFDWDSYSVDSKTSSGNIYEKIRQHNQESVKNKFKNIFEYISVALGVLDQNFHSSSDYKLIDAPIFFKINYDDVFFEEDKITILCKSYPIGRINVVVDIYNNRGGSHPYSWKDRITIPHSLSGHPKNPEEFTIEGEIKELTLNDGFEISVYRENGLLIYHRSTSNVQNYWPSKSTITNPIFPVFQEFVSDVELRKMIFESKNKKSKFDSDYFEKGVTWLLSLMGVNVIWLGKDYESTGTGTEQISLDILGNYKTNTILLINATTGVPPDSIFVREKRFKENILKKLTTSEIKVKSVLFCNASVNTLKDKSEQNDVILIGKEELENIIDHIMKGDTDKARQFFFLEDDF